MKYLLKYTFIPAIFFCLTFSFSFIAQANLPTTELTQEYNNVDFNLRMSFPASWHMQSYTTKPNYLQFSVFSPSKFPAIGVIVGPHKQSEPPKPTPPGTVTKNGQFEATILLQEEPVISGYKARMSAHRLTDYKSIDTYTILCLIQTPLNDYVITMQGNYSHFEDERKIFDDVIKTVQLPQPNPVQ